MIGKQPRRFATYAPFAVGVLVLLACSAKKDDSASPAMMASLKGLRDLPLTRQTLPDIGAIDAGSSSTNVETTTNFGDTEAGGDIVSTVGTNIATGNGPGNGGVSTGNGPGNGGVGTGTGPGGGGVGSSNGAGNGGVSPGIAFGSTGELVTAVCDFLSALCTSFSKCSSGEVEIECDNPVFRLRECVPLMTDALAHTKKPVVVPPNAVSALRCVTNVVRNSACLLTDDFEKGFESKVAACGLPMTKTSDDSSDDQVTDTPNQPDTTGTPTTTGQ